MAGIIDKARQELPQPTRQQQHQSFIDHITSRAQQASELRAQGRLGQGGYTQKDLDAFKNYFGEDIDDVRRGGEADRKRYAPKTSEAQVEPVDDTMQG